MSGRGTHKAGHLSAPRRARPGAGAMPRMLLAPLCLALGSGAFVFSHASPPDPVRLTPPGQVALAGATAPLDLGASSTAAAGEQAAAVPATAAAVAGPAAPVAPTTAPGTPQAGSGDVSPPAPAAAVATTVAQPTPASADEAQVLDVLGIVFDLARPFAQKAAYVEGADGLAPLYERFVSVGGQLGQIELRPRDVVAGTDEAQFTFDALLDGTTIRQGIPGTMRRVGPAWQLTRTSMCLALTLTGLACPA